MPLISTVSVAIFFNFSIFSPLGISSPKIWDALFTVDWMKILGSKEYAVSEIKTNNKKYKLTLIF